MTGGTPSSAIPAVLNDPLRNHGAAFTEAEREALGLTGRLPAAVLTLEQQAQRSYVAARLHVAAAAQAAPGYGRTRARLDQRPVRRREDRHRL